ncbi:hypothetical protein GLS40_09570 [Pseudooceanicola sp. 216_PA32_1]|uniref:SsuA/THI5-like domain-containing protein n=1 Tax=Pseudooceanicola pacificus TaxID=2676438 RepID=A0A844WD51_9RHOB|nr:ABC transporter substrate-binding protein [Pseudooceanicola pacificus]MWB78272.1 hypothetical protein [Pseudooceanicola pacificus]
MKLLTTMMSAGAAAAMALSVAIPARADEKVVFAQSGDVILWAPLYIARERGYLADEGIDAEAITVKGGPATLAAVEAGNAQIALGFPATPITAFTKGIGVTLFGSLSTEYVASLVVQGDVAKDLGITQDMSVKDKIGKLKGHSIATNAAGSAADYLLQNLVRYAGMQPDRDMTITPVGDTSAVLAAFERKRIDGFMATPPSDRLAMDNFGAVKLIDFTRGEYEGVAGIQYVAMSASTDWLATHGDTAAAVLRAMDKALALIHDNPEEAKASVRTFFKDMDDTIFEAGWDGTVGSFPANAKIREDSIVKILNFMELMSGAKVDVNMADIYTNQYYEMSLSGQ